MEIWLLKKIYFWEKVFELGGGVFWGVSNGTLFHNGNTFFQIKRVMWTTSGFYAQGTAQRSPQDVPQHHTVHQKLSVSCRIDGSTAPL